MTPEQNKESPCTRSKHKPEYRSPTQLKKKTELRHQEENRSEEGEGSALESSLPCGQGCFFARSHNGLAPSMVPVGVTEMSSRRVPGTRSSPVTRCVFFQQALRSARVCNCSSRYEPICLLRIFLIQPDLGNPVMAHVST